MNHPMETALHASYNPWLVLLSVVVGIGASYMALELTGRVHSAAGPARRHWLVAGMVLSGLGIWSMHFIGMLAFHLDMPIRYDAGLTLASLAIAIAASGVALGFASRPTLPVRALLAGGTTMGLAIAAMHYTGMAAMRLPGLMSYHPVLFALSIAIGICAAVTALWLAFCLKGEGFANWGWRKLGSAIVMGIGIAGTHYTAMAALSIVPSDVTMAGTSLSLSVTELDAVVIGFGAMFVLAVGLLGAVKDHLRDKQTTLEVAQRQLAAIVESSHDAIMAMTLDGRLTSWNPAADRLFGYPATEAIGRPISLLASSLEHDDIPPLLARLQHGEAIQAFETVRRHRDGHPLHVSLSLSPVRDTHGQLVGISAIARDFSERKRAEEQAVAFAAQLAEANAQLRSADQHKDEFLSVISHELRTPLNFIMGFASIVDDEVVGALNAEQRAYMGKILTGSERMLTLVNDLLDVAKLQAGRFDMAPCPTPYAPMVDEVIASLRPLADQRDLRLVATVEASVSPVVDSGRIVQVLTNLIGNAIKFTEPGGRVSIRTFVRGDELVTQVMDTGVGIAPEDIPKLFQRFGQLDMSLTRQSGGTGLGLSISKALVEAHGGDIGVLSEPGYGSTFWFTLPLGAGSGDPEAHSPSRAAQSL